MRDRNIMSQIIRLNLVLLTALQIYKSPLDICPIFEKENINYADRFVLPLYISKICSLALKIFDED